MDIDQDGQTLSPVETRDNLNLQRVRMVPLLFLPSGPIIGGNNKKKEVNKN